MIKKIKQHGNIETSVVVERIGGEEARTRGGGRHSRPT